MSTRFAAIRRHNHYKNRRFQMADRRPPLKSILKAPGKLSATTAAPRQTTAAAKTTREKTLALQYNSIVQTRRETEVLILEALEALIDFPRSPEGTSGRPSATDAHAFSAFLRPFRPNDYDELITERNVNERCGYTLCPRARVRVAKKGTWKLIGVGGKAEDFRVVKREEAEKWCAEEGAECARRAMWVRVQLDERPAWERMSGKDEIQLLVEDIIDDQTPTDGDKDASNMVDTDMDMDCDVQMVEDKLQGFAIHENMSTGTAVAPRLGDDLPDRLGNLHLSLDGYTPSFGEPRAQKPG